MDFKFEATVPEYVLENYRSEKMEKEQRLLELAWTLNLGEGIGIHTRQIERLEFATNEELARWLVMDAYLKYL